ncbi:uncharacterized protein LOC121972925 [Zingiber officinale]|uniref:Uncharacterized protein n=1 Tax=Zingiber officinale TaxID=94328 RepID=A0A8J5H4B6_ZINOF|nr:uncharacterized protein LOC121972925 [Zingiber officinale]KAG6516208.1 hypothetical protein ZIOFF_026661 [Zingiber officinale]
METSRRQRGPIADRFLGLFAASPRSTIHAVGDELHEDDDAFWFGSESSHLDPIRTTSLGPAPPTSVVTDEGPRLVYRRSYGILDALSDDDKKPHAFIYRRVTFVASPPAARAESSPVLSARMIPVMSKPKLDYSRSMPAGKIYQQSAPVNVPAMSTSVAPKLKKWWEELDMEGGDGDRDGHEMLPPHEIVARASGNRSPMFTFSVLEGAGRTLKGRDLRRVRNAVLEKTGGEIAGDTDMFDDFVKEMLSYL